MKISFDQTTDYSFRELHKFLKKAEVVPEYVKEASESYDYSKLPKEAFADQHNRVFPKNTKSATYLSYVHFINKKAALENKYSKGYAAEVEAKIKSAANMFGIASDLEEYNSSLLKKEARDYTEQAVFETQINGATIQLFPFKTAAELKLASEQFSRDYKKIPFDWRFSIANNFVKHAHELELEELPDIICKYAGMFYAHPDHVKNELNRRANRNPSADYKPIYEKLAEQVEGLDTVEDFMKIASTCYYMEQLAGIYDNYKTASLFGDPVDQLFNLSVEKVANELDVIKLGSDYYKIKDLQDINSDIYKQAFGTELDPKNAEDLRDILPTMPLSDVSLFRELSGIKPL